MYFVRPARLPFDCDSYLSFTSTVQLIRSKTEERERLPGDYFFAQRSKLRCAL